LQYIQVADKGRYLDDKVEEEEDDNDNAESNFTNLSEVLTWLKQERMDEIFEDFRQHCE